MWSEDEEGVIGARQRLTRQDRGPETQVPARGNHLDRRVESAQLVGQGRQLLRHELLEHVAVAHGSNHGGGVVVGEVGLYDYNEQPKRLLLRKHAQQPGADEVLTLHVGGRWHIGRERLQDASEALQLLLVGSGAPEIGLDLRVVASKRS